MVSLAPLLLSALLLLVNGSSIIEPVIRTNFMDPCIIQVNNTWYAFGGANGLPAGINVQLASSTDFTSWTLHENWDALPGLGSWAANPGHVWSPDVNETPSGNFVMYYSATAKDHPDNHCIGAAVSPNITGPYTPLPSHYPCAFSAGGAIDPDGFYDASSDTHHLIYKVDGNANGSGGACANSNTPRTPTPFYILTMDSTDLTTAIGGPVFVAGMGVTDGPDIEGPSMYEHAGTYYLIYNDGCYATPAYTIRYVVCAGAGARCLSATETHRQTTNGAELLGTQGSRGLLAPGGMDVAQDGVHVVFHGDLNAGWVENRTGRRVRGLYAATLEYSSGGRNVSVGDFAVKSGAILPLLASFSAAGVVWVVVVVSFMSYAML